MTRIKPLWIVGLLLVGFFHRIVAQHSAVVSASPIGSVLGGKVNFTCPFHSGPISRCMWTHNIPAGSGKVGVALDFTLGRRAQATHSGYLYMGKGLDKGDCGVIIEIMKEADSGIWTCFITTEEGLLRGDVDVNIFKKPDPPQFNPSRMENVMISERLEELQTDSRITCYTTNGYPSPFFRWFIDNDLVSDGLLPVNVTVRNNISYTSQSIPTSRFTWRDNGKQLRCVVQHDTLSENDNKEVFMNINIKFNPRQAQKDAVGVQNEIGAVASLLQFVTELFF